MCLYKKASEPKYAWYIGGLMASHMIMAHLLLTEYNCKIWEIFTFSIYFVATQKVSPLSQYRMSLHSWLTCEIYRLFSCRFMDIKNFGFSAPLACFGGLARFGDIVYICTEFSPTCSGEMPVLWKTAWKYHQMSGWPIPDPSETENASGCQATTARGETQNPQGQVHAIPTGRICIAT